MNRPLIFLAAMATAAAAVTSACLAEVRSSDRPFRADDIHFSLTDKGTAGSADFRLYQGDRQHNGSFDNGTRLADLGLQPDALRRDGPITLAMVREAGRIDCNGTARSGKADGKCRFTANADFNRALAAAGVEQPTLEDSYGMTILGVSRALVDALRGAGYGPPDADQLMAFAAVGVDSAYIADLSRRGYRPKDLDDLVAFKAVGVTPAYVDSLMKSGLANLDAETIVSMRALDINADFIAGFTRIGYRDIDPDQLVALKALGVTPEMVQALEHDHTTLSIPQRQVAADLIRKGRR